MEKLERNKFTRAGEIANERLVEAVLDPDRYPEGTTFVAADQEGFDSILAEAAEDHRGERRSPQRRKSALPDAPPIAECKAVER